MELLGVTTLALVISVTCLIFLFVWTKSHKAVRLPPGPTLLPVIGNMLQLNLKDVPASLSKLAKEYGPVYTLYLGSWSTVVLYGYDMVKEALINQDDEFLGRMYNLWPVLIKYLPGKHKEFSKRLYDVKIFILEKVKDHQESLDPDNPRDFIDCFLSKMEQEKYNLESEFELENLAVCGSNLFTTGTETTSITLRFGLLLLMKHPEVEDTPNVLDEILTLWKAKVHEEIDRVIGRNQSPSMKGKMKLPYTEAVLHEIQRHITLSPSNLSHAVTWDTKFKQYVIPKGTTVLSLLCSILLDCQEFPNPEKFDPGHFLDEKSCFKKTDYFVPFSLGKQACVGESLGHMQSFLFITSILQNFSLKPFVEPKEIDTKPITTRFINIPPPYKLCLIPR